MAQARTAIANKPVWVDLSSKDAEGSRKFYSQLFGWKVDVNPDPQYGGYGMAVVDGQQVAGIGPQMQSQQGAPTAWSLYIGVDDAQALAKKVEQAGGKVVAPPFKVGDQGTMAVFQDPSGAFISAWQPDQMAGQFPIGQANSFGWGELDGRGVEKAVPFYQKVFGWSPKKTDMGQGQPPYIEFQLDGQSILGAMEWGDQTPQGMPNFWLVYFTVTDVDKSAEKAKSLGGQVMTGPTDFPGGRFAIVQDPQGAVFGLLKTNPRQGQ